MNKRSMLIGLAVVGVLAVAGGAFYWQSSRNNDSKTAGSSASTSTNSSILGISESGKAQKCTMSYSGNNGTGTGTIYTDGNGQGRYTFSANTEQGNSGEINQILKDSTSYAWLQSGGKTIGFKMQATSTSSSSSTSTSGPSLTDKFKMECSAWTVDESKFAVPTDINFLDANALNPMNN